MTLNNAFWCIYRYVQGSWLLTLSVLFGLTGVTLATGLAIRFFFDTLELADNQGIWIVVVLIGAGQLGQIVLNLLGVWLDIITRHRVSALVRKNMMKHTLKQPANNALDISGSATVSHYRDDVGEIANFYSSYGLMYVFSVSFFALVNLSILAWISARVTLFVFFPLTVVVFIAHYANERVQQYREANRKSAEAVTGFIGEMLGAIQSIKVGKSESNILAKFGLANDKRRIAAIRDKLFSQQIAMIFTNIGNIGSGLILLASAPLMRIGSFSVGDFAFFAFNFTFIVNVAQVYGTTITRYQQSKVSLNRVRDLLKTNSYDEIVEHGPIYFDKPIPPVPDWSPVSRFERLDIEDLSYKFPDGSIGIENINLTLKRGSFTVIMGKIGSGKTTLLRVILGLHPKSSGQIYWNGDPVEQPSEFFKPPRTAYIPQVPTLFSESLKNNILLGLPENKVDIDNAIHNSVMTYDLERLSDGLETLVGPRGAKLSGGQKQRTATARMLVTNSDVLVFDDLSSALDVQTEKTLWSQLRESNNETTYLSVSHRPAALNLADQIIVLDQGQIIARGTLEELLEKSPEARRLAQQSIDN